MKYEIPNEIAAPKAPFIGIKKKHRIKNNPDHTIANIEIDPNLFL